MPVGTYASAVHIDVAPPEDEFDYVLKDSGSKGFDTTEKVHAETTASMSLTAGNTVLVWLSTVNGNNSGTINIMTCAASGWTFTRHGNAYRGGAYVCTEAWFVATVPSTGSYTFNIGTAVTAFYVHYAVWEITGAAVSAVGGVVEPGFSDSQDDGAKTITLHVAPAADSIVFAGLQMDAPAVGGRGATPGAGWTEEFEINISSEYGYTQLMTRTGSTSANVSWADVAIGAASGCGCSAIEIKKASIAVVEFPPYVRSSVNTINTVGTSNAINMPSLIEAGDVILCLGGNDVPGSTDMATTSTGWTRVRHDLEAANLQRMSAFAKIATGGSGADPLTVTASDTDVAFVTMAIARHGVSNVSTDILFGTPANGTSNTADPPSLNAGVSKEWLWLAWMILDQNTVGAAVPTTVPTNYSSVAITRSANTNSATQIAVAKRTFAADTQDPSAFGGHINRPWITNTIAIPPASVVSTEYEIMEPFTYSNNASLATASGGAWIDIDGPPIWTVASNAAFYDKAGAGFAYCQVLSTANLSSPDHYAQADITSTSLVNNYICILVRGADLGSGAGSWIEVGISNTNLVIYEVTNLSYSSALLTVAHGQTAPYTNTFKVSMVGSDITIEFGTFGITFVSTAFPSNVKVGFGCGSQQGADVIFDNFIADVITPPSPFNPLRSIPWRTAFWASDPDQAVPSNGANVTAWRQPGAIQIDEWVAAGTAIPTFVSSWVNGKPCINLGADARLTSAYSPANTLYTTVVIVGATTDASTSDLCDDPTASTARLLIDRLSGDWRIYRGGSVLAVAGANSNAHLFIARYNNTTGDYLKIDGVTRISGSATGTSAGQRIALGSTATGAHNASRVAFAGVLTGRDLTTTELDNLLAWFHTEYKVAPTLVQTWSADYSTATTPKASDSFTWLTGDLFVVMAMSSETGTGWVAPTATGLTFAAHGTAVTGGTRCNGHKWTATAASGSSGTISMGATGGSQWGYTVWQFRNHGGAGGTTAALGSVAVAVGADGPGAITLNGSKSAVCFIAGDREAVAGGMSMSPTSNPTPTERVDGTSSEYGYLVGDWIGLPAGTQTLTIPSGEYATRFMTYLILEVQAL